MKTMTDTELLDKLIVTAQHETSTHELDKLRASVLERMATEKTCAYDHGRLTYTGDYCPACDLREQRKQEEAETVKVKAAFEEAIFVACIEAQQRGTVDGVEASVRSTNIERRLRSMAPDATMKDHGEAGRVLAAESESEADALLDAYGHACQSIGYTKGCVVGEGIPSDDQISKFNNTRNDIKAKMAPWPTPEQVEDYIRALPWTSDTPDIWRTLVAGNIRTAFSSFSNNWESK